MGHCIIMDNDGTLRAQIPGTLIIEHQQDQMVHANLTFTETPVGAAATQEDTLAVAK